MSLVVAGWYLIGLAEVVLWTFMDSFANLQGQLDSLDLSEQLNTDLVGMNWNQSMGIKELKSCSVNQTVRAGSLAR